ncbi:MAG: hypothetical protein J5875_02650, partial [Paludibacteraceae bacterium]|nr:hypothetical protein [Paludibacteraceae bacterium]
SKEALDNYSKIISNHNVVWGSIADVDIDSANNVSLSQLTVASGGHLNVSAGGTITLGSGFNAQLGSVVLNQQFTESLSEPIVTSGMYVLRIETDGGALVGQFMVP